MARFPKKDKNICCPKNSFLDVPAVSLIAADCGQHGMALGIIEPTSTLHICAVAAWQQHFGRGLIKEEWCNIH